MIAASIIVGGFLMAMASGDRHWVVRCIALLCLMGIYVLVFTSGGL